MNRDNIIRMAHEAGFMAAGHPMNPWSADTDQIEVFAALVAAQNRPWVKLTDEEIKSLPSWWPSYEDAPALVQLVKDVETKLKEKNGG